jgi:hypothetical protein
VAGSVVGTCFASVLLDNHAALENTFVDRSIIARKQTLHNLSAMAYDEENPVMF